MVKQIEQHSIFVKGVLVYVCVYIDRCVYVCKYELTLQIPVCGRIRGLFLYFSNMQDEHVGSILPTLGYCIEGEVRSLL